MPRRIIAAVMGVIFLAITISPLAMFAMRFAIVAHAITGECSGDCATCGCSLERTMSRTCCCWQKKLKHHDNHDEQKGDCCNKTKNGKTAEMISVCPCGNGKLIDVWGAERYELLPYHCAEAPAPPREGVQHHTFTQRLTSRHNEPPDPPPKLSLSFMHSC